MSAHPPLQCVEGYAVGPRGGSELVDVAIGNVGAVHGSIATQSVGAKGCELLECPSDVGGPFEIFAGRTDHAVEPGKINFNHFPTAHLCDVSTAGFR